MDDGFVHFNRIQSIANNIQTQGFIGAIQQRVYFNTFENMGYAFPTFYGDMILYPFALLELALGKYIKTYWIMGLYFSIIGVASITQFRYYLGKIYNKDAVKLISLFYVSMPYFNYFVLRQSAGEVVGWLVYPGIFYGFSKILNMKDQDKFSIDGYKVLTIWMQILILNHIISAYIVCWTLAIWCISRIKVILKPNRLKTLLISAITTVGLTSYFIFPMLEQLSKDYLVINHTVNNLYDPIQLSIGNLFLPSWFFTILKVTTGFNETIIQGNGFSPAYFGLIFLIVAVIIWQKQRGLKGDNLKIVVMTLGIIFISTPLVRIAQPVFEKIQFPFRFLGILSFMTLIFILKNWDRVTDKHIKQIISVLLMTTQLVALESNLVYSDYIDKVGNVNIQLQIGTGCEYLPYISDYTKYGVVSFRDQYNANELLRDMGSSGVFEIDTEIVKGGYTIEGLNELKRDAEQILLPITYNPNYSAFDKDGNEYPINLGSYGLVEVADVERGINNLNILYTYQDVEIYSTILQLITLGLFLVYTGYTALKLKNKN